MTIKNYRIDEIFWKSVPFVRFVIPLILGIILQRALSLAFEVILLFVLVLILTCLSLHKKNRYKFNKFHAISYTSVFIVLGMLVYQSRCQQQFDPTSASNEHIINAKIIKSPISKEKSIQLSLNASYVSLRKPKNKSVKILAYIFKDSLSSKLNIGDHIMATANLTKPASPIISGGFDYAEFLKNKNISYQTYITSSSWEKLDHPLTVWDQFQRKLSTIRNHCSQVVYSSSTDSSSASFITALSLGEKQYLDESIKDNFSDSGLMHILAVSGLHLGIISQLLLILIGLNSPKLHFKLNVIFRILVLLVGIWLFALLMGFSSSIQRSALMFSLLYLGKLSNRDSSGINSLAASAFLLLLFQPNLIYDVGFQLSYSAMLGILIIYPPISKLLWTKNKNLRYVSQILIISTCATISTLPFTLLYFGKFPGLFLISNLLVLPVLPILMYSSYSIYLISIFSQGIIMNVTAKLPILLSKYVLFITEFIGSIELFSLENLQIDMIQSILIILGISMMLIVLYLRPVKLKHWALYLFIVISYSNFRTIQDQTKARFIDSQTSYGSPFKLIQYGKETLILYNKDELVNEKDRQFQVLNRLPKSLCLRELYLEDSVYKSIYLLI